MSDETHLPPTEADFLDDDIRPKPAWPKVIGIISIIWGALGLVCNILGTGWMFIQPSFMQSAADQMQGGVPPQMLQLQVPLIGLMIFGVVWAIVLIVAGAMTAGRKPAGRKAHLVWAIVAMITGVVGTYVNLQYQNGITDWIRDNPSSDFAQQPGAGGGGSMIGIVLGLVLAFAWPVFTTVWFLMVKRRDSDLAEGVEELVA